MLIKSGFQLLFATIVLQCPLVVPRQAIALVIFAEQLSNNLQIVESLSTKVWLLPKLQTKQINNNSEFQVEASRLLEEGSSHYNRGDWHMALVAWQEAYAIYQQTDNRVGQAEARSLIGDVYQQLGEYLIALEYYNASLEITHKLGNQMEEIRIRHQIGNINYLLGNYSDAQKQYEASLMITRELDSRAEEARTLNLIGNVNRRLQNYLIAQRYYEASLVIVRELDDRIEEAKILNNIGNMESLLGNYSMAQEDYEASLEIMRELKDQAGEMRLLNNVGNMNQQQGNYLVALEYHQASLEITRTVGNQIEEARTLNNIGNVNYLVGNYSIALENYKASLEITYELRDRFGEARTLNNIANVNYWLRNYQIALENYEASLEIVRQIGNQAEEARTLNNIGNVNQQLGLENYSTVREYYEASLMITRALGDSLEEARTLHGIGILNQRIERYPQALENLEDSLEIIREIDHQVVLLNNIGLVSEFLGEDPAVQGFYETRLVIAREINNVPDEVSILNSIGNVNYLLGNYSVAQENYELGLEISRIHGDRSGEALALKNLGYLLEAKEQPELAIIFLKEAVNIYEGIRSKHSSLVNGLQQLYINAIEDDYRFLADLLLQQNRILEAQQVLDLLKVQELDDYLRGVRGVNTRLTILRPEQEILQRYNALQQTVIEVGQELTALRQRFYETGSLPSADEQRLDELLTIQEDLNNQFNAFLASPDIQALVSQLSPHNQPTLEATQRDALFQSFDDLQDDLANLNAVLIYPLILEDRLELIITLPDSETPPLRRTVQFEDSAELNRAISALREALRDPNSDAITPAQTLYAYLIEPLEADLAEVTATLTAGELPTIIYAPDGALRYIPLAALHDGDQWLSQRFRINNITAESLTEFQAVPTASPQVLAGAFADPDITYTVFIDGEDEVFAGLPFAGQEVQNLVASLNQINHFMDIDFGWTQVRRLLGGANILHLATHAAFVPGAPENSFILFGNGDRAILECLDPTIQTEDSLSCINNWQLNNVDLVVLSACETGLVGQLTDGKEVLGLGYQFQSRGARAVIASLWKVSDGGTQALMNAFYQALQQPSISKSEALRLAQVALITGDYSIVADTDRGIVDWGESVRANLPDEVANRLNHPYYWAPFILIGNGL